MVTMTAHSVPDSGIVHQEPLTEAYVKETSVGTGTLYITESHKRFFQDPVPRKKIAPRFSSADHKVILVKVLWLSNGGDGLALDYPNISIHAISRDTATFPHECLFMILDIALDAEEQMEDEDDDSQTSSTELRFVPSQKENLDQMYQAMCACQELHPDPEQDDSGDDFYGEEELIGDGPRISAQGLENLARMEQMLSANGDMNGTAAGSNPDHEEEEEMDDSQFEDA